MKDGCQIRGWALQKPGYNRDTCRSRMHPHRSIITHTTHLFSLAFHRPFPKYTHLDLQTLFFWSDSEKRTRPPVWGWRRLTGSFASLGHTSLALFLFLLGEEGYREPTSFHLVRCLIFNSTVQPDPLLQRGHVSILIRSKTPLADPGRFLEGVTRRVFLSATQILVAPRSGTLE